MQNQTATARASKKAPNATQPPKRKHNRQSERPKHDAKFLTDYAVADRFQVSRPTVWRWVKEEGFPAPLKLSANVTRWRASDIEAWESAREVAA